MGVPGLWTELEPCQTVTTLTALSLTKFNSPSRGFRVGIDASIWFFHAEYGKEGENPELRTLFFRCAQLTSHGFLPLFIFDGPKRPDFKRGKKINKSSNKLVNGMKEILDAFGFEHRTAPGEAEAELALLNRIGVIDGILSDDVDNFLFGARTVIRNHSSTHASAAASSSNEKVKAVVYDLPHPKLSYLEPADLIFVALCSGGDYDSTGLPSCGIKIALGLARAGFGKSLYKAATTMDKDSQRFQDFLVSWRSGLAHELATNSTGFLPMKKPSVAGKIPRTFPRIDVLFSYIHPITSETLGRLDRYDDLLIGHGKLDGWLKKDPSLLRLAERCEFYFEWGFMESIIKRFRTVIFHGVVLRILRRAILEREHGDDRGQSPVLDWDFINKHFTSNMQVETSSESFPNLANRIRSTRQHASTSETLEYRLEIEPSILVKLTASGVKGIRRPDEDEWAYLDEQEDGSDSEPCNARGSPKKKDPPSPHDKLRIWIPAEILCQAAPYLIEEYDQRKKKSKKRKPPATTSPSKPKPKANSKDSCAIEDIPPLEKENRVDPVQAKPQPKKDRAKAKVPVSSASDPPPPVPGRSAKNRLLAALDGDPCSSDEDCDYNALWGVGPSRPPPVASKPGPLGTASLDEQRTGKAQPPSTNAKPVIKDLTKGRSKNPTARRPTSSNTMGMTSISNGGIDSFYSSHKPVASAVTAKAKGKAKAVPVPSASDKYRALCNQLDDKSEQEGDSTLPDEDALFDYLAKATSNRPKPHPASSSDIMHYGYDPFVPPAGPPDTPSPIKPTTSTRRRPSISSDDSLPSSAVPKEKERLNKSPRKSREHTSPRKALLGRDERQRPIRTISDITHPSRSRRACSPTPGTRSVPALGLKSMRSSKPLPLINISSGESSTDTDEETKVTAKPAKTMPPAGPLEAARARIRPKKVIEVIDLT
ncbi:hypothetical protein PM082_005776 [Marasmius tenuissimus]|nr:hypothetical protein PM082_005776 [Marasmius tenuissimus]